MATCAYQGNNCSYVYGCDGIRHQSTVNGTTTNYVLDNSMFVREQRGGANYATYLVGPRGPEYRRDDTTGAIRWYVYDGLGCVAAEVDPSGNVTAKRKYDVYGLVRSGDAGTSAHKFVGQLGHPSEAESGLVYMRARYMDPAIGRFLSRDHAQVANRYLYCADDPVDSVDPSGNVSLGDTATSTAIAMGIGGSGGNAVMAVLGDVQSELAQICAREDLELTLEIVEDGTVEDGFGGGRFFARGDDIGDMVVQLERGSASPDVLCHELSEMKSGFLYHFGFQNFMFANQFKGELLQALQNYMTAFGGG